MRLHQQVLYDSDVFNANGTTIDKQYLSPRSRGDKWSSYRFGLQKPPPRDFSLWKEALTQLAPGGRRRTRLGKFLFPGHKIWPWRYDPINEHIFLLTDGTTQKYTKQASTRRARHSFYSYAGDTVQDTSHFPFCSVVAHDSSRVTMGSYYNPPSSPAQALHFHELLLTWGNQAFWKNLRYTGDGLWIYQAIQDHSLICVSDGSYMEHLHSEVCSTAIILECSRGRGRLSLSFAEKSIMANSFRGDLLGLLAVHLLLHSFDLTFSPSTGAVKVYSDCTGALHTVRSLPKSRLPASLTHSDILKTISIHGREFGFSITYHHVKAHQDDTIDWAALSRPSQLNCACDAAAKRCILEYIPGDEIPAIFPREPVSLVIGNQKITSNSCSSLRFHAHRQEAKSIYSKMKILSPDQFEEVDWEAVHSALHKVPKMFQLFAGKQVFNVSAVLGNLSKQKEHSHLGNKCPSCETDKETCEHILYCNEEGRRKNLNLQIYRIRTWLEEVGTNPHLTTVLLNFLLTRGTMIYRGRALTVDHPYIDFWQSQETIGWQCTMEGMLSIKLRDLDPYDILDPSSKISIPQWRHNLITKLLEATHGQWIYRNLTMHDNISGMLVNNKK